MLQTNATTNRYVHIETQNNETEVRVSGVNEFIKILVRVFIEALHSKEVDGLSVDTNIQ